MHHPTDRITHHSLCYTSRGALAGARNSCEHKDPPDRVTVRTVTEVRVVTSLGCDDLKFRPILTDEAVLDDLTTSFGLLFSPPDRKLLKKIKNIQPHIIIS